MSEIILNQVQTEQTASSRFFNDPETLHVDAFNFSQDFWLAHHDLLAEGFGVVFGSGLDRYGQLTELDDATKQFNLTVMFDARRRHEGIYAWQYGLANQNTGRVLEQMTVSMQSMPLGTLLGVLQPRRLVFNSQGTLESIDRDIVDGFSLMKKLEDCTKHPVFIQQVTELRTRRKRAEADLSRFSVEGITKFARQRYNKLLKQKQEQADSLGFVALQPFEFSKG